MARTPVTALSLAGALLLAMPAPASAGRRGGKTRVAGSYNVTFEQVADNCTQTGISLRNGTVKLSTGRRLSVTVPMVPIMWGNAGKGGKFSAEAKRGKTGIAGVDGKFSVAGGVKGKHIQFVFIAEYYRGRKPLCTQSWNVTGQRAKR